MYWPHREGAASVSYVGSRDEEHEATRIAPNPLMSASRAEPAQIRSAPSAKPRPPKASTQPREPRVDQAMGTVVEEAGAGVVRAIRRAAAVLQAKVFAPFRRQAVATWSKLRGKRMREFEQVGDDRFDRQRAREWESFNRARTSSSYLQDTDAPRK